MQCTAETLGRLSHYEPVGSLLSDRLAPSIAAAKTLETISATVVRRGKKFSSETLCRVDEPVIEPTAGHVTLNYSLYGQPSIR